MSARSTILDSSQSAIKALTSGYAAMKLNDVPDLFEGGVAAIKLTDVVGAVSVTWYLSADADGDQPLTPVRTDTLLGRTAGKGGVACSLEGVAVPTWNAAGQIYVQAKLDAGTANGTAILAWK